MAQYGLEIRFNNNNNSRWKPNTINKGQDYDKLEDFEYVYHGQNYLTSIRLLSFSFYHSIVGKSSQISRALTALVAGQGGSMLLPTFQPSITFFLRGVSYQGPSPSTNQLTSVVI